MVADHLSRYPDEFDIHINDETEHFERFIYPIHSIDSSEEMKLRHSEDPVLVNARNCWNVRT